MTPRPCAHCATVNTNSEFLRSSAGGCAAQDVSCSTICRKQIQQKIFEKRTNCGNVHALEKLKEYNANKKKRERATKIVLKGPGAPAAQVEEQFRTQLALRLDAAVNGGKKAGANEELLQSPKSDLLYTELV
jgi:hypothetical protein